MRKMIRLTILAVLAVGSLALFSPAFGERSGSLTTAEFPDVADFDFEQVHENYERAGENVGKVVPLLEDTLSRGLDAVEAGERAEADPSEENQRRFVGAVLGFVRGAADNKARIAGMAEEVRGINSQTAILYTQGTTQTESRIEALRREFEREEVKYKEIAAENRQKRRSGDLSDWEMRRLFETEKRQAQVLNRLADRIAFQQDFLAALDEVSDQSVKDFTLYEQFFAEAADALTDISELASNMPLIVERLQMASALAENLPSRQAAVTGFNKIEETRELTRRLGQQLMDMASGGLVTAKGEDAETSDVILRHTEVFRRWTDGEAIEYRRPPAGDR